MYQYAELVHWMKNPTTMKILPATIDIDLTNICDQDCYYCNTAEFRKSHPVQKKYTDYITLLERLASWRAHTPNSYGTTHTITYSGGGEPTLLKGYEYVVEKSIDLGFLVGITTNGSRLEKLVENINHEKLKKIGWVGVDLDAGSKELYEKIRRSIPKESLFDRVISNIKSLVNIGVPVDVKILIGEYNNHQEALVDIFKLAKELQVRQVFFRPVSTRDSAFVISDIVPTLDQLSKEYAVTIKVSDSKNVERNYNRCHQMFQFPVFCADGNIYTCCENKGNPQFSIGSWIEGDFRDIWLAERHMSVYNTTNTKLCPPCGPNNHNICTQNILNNPDKIETLYY